MGAYVALEITELTRRLCAYFTLENVSAPAVGGAADVLLHGVVLAQVLFRLQTAILEHDVARFRAQGLESFHSVIRWLRVFVLRVCRSDDWNALGC